MIWQELPNANRKHDKGNAAHGCASSISSCRLKAPIYSVQAFLLLAFALVLCHQGHAAGEDRRKGKEQATETRSKLLGEHTRTRGYKTSQNKAQQKLPPFGTF